MLVDSFAQEGVGNIAINDAFMLEGAIYYLLKKHFRKDSCYVGLLELFHDVRIHFRSAACCDSHVSVFRPHTKLSLVS